MATVNLEKMTKVYPNGKPAVLDLDLDVAEGELMVLVGPSGSGKTTALRMVAGLEDITSGTLRMGGKVVNDLAPKDRNVAMVFQSYALYPHMTVAENIGFSLKLRKVPKSEVQAKVKDAAALLGLTDYLDRKPSQLSGGQRQRVAMGRAIVREPSVFLMDEPLSNLDAKMRVQMRAEISRIQRRVGVATFYVTHDQTEAMTMGDRVAVLHMGELQQCDTPQYLYEHPNNLFVAAFIGSPAMNLYEAIISPEADAVRVGSQTLALAETQLQARPALRGYRDRKVIIGIRPEDLDDPALATRRRPRHHHGGRHRAGGGARQRAPGPLPGGRDQGPLRGHPGGGRDRGAGRAARPADGRGQGRRGGPHLAPQRLPGRLPGHLRGPHRTAPLLRRRQRPSDLGLS